MAESIYFSIGVPMAALIVLVYWFTAAWSAGYGEITRFGIILLFGSFNEYDTADNIAKLLFFGLAFGVLAALVWPIFLLLFPAYLLGKYSWATKKARGES